MTNITISKSDFKADFIRLIKAANNNLQLNKSWLQNYYKDEYTPYQLDKMINQLIDDKLVTRTNVKYIHAGQIRSKSYFSVADEK